jgi:uncharacterized damage-inducible protein DinB
MPPLVSEKLQYPIGRFTFNPIFSEEELSKHINSIGGLPTRLSQALNGMDAGHWDTPYRPGGWTVRQVVHHLADSHINSYIRFRLALTEQKPIIKPYLEEQWAELPDVAALPPGVSVQLLEALHTRWVSLMEAMEASDWKKTVIHPERQREITLWEMVALYAWHGEHHLAHVGLVAKGHAG